jgi:GNAT superfamily N-acetyltransferase
MHFLDEPDSRNLASAMSPPVDSVRIERVDPASADARWCLEQYFAELRRRFEEGFDPAKSIPADDAEFRPPHGAFVVGSLHGSPVACGCVRAIGPGVAYLKRMWVSDSVRGMGLGRKMLAALEAQSLELGLNTVKLETNRALVEAIQLYRRSGYAEVSPFNDETYAHHWFEKHLVPESSTRARQG